MLPPNVVIYAHRRSKESFYLLLQTSPSTTLYLLCSRWLGPELNFWNRHLTRKLVVRPSEILVLKKFFNGFPTQMAVEAARQLASQEERSSKATSQNVSNRKLLARKVHFSARTVTAKAQSNGSLWSRRLLHWDPYSRPVAALKLYFAIFFQFFFVNAKKAFTKVPHCPQHRGTEGRNMIWNSSRKIAFRVY